MSELVAVAFDTPDEADKALNALTRLQREYLIDLEDAVVAVRAPDGKVRLKQSVNLVGTGAASGALWGGLWGGLVGLLFLNPLLGWVTGVAFGGGAGALAGKLSDFGINDDFMRSLSQSLKPDSSALFVLVRKVQPEKVLQELSQFRGKLLRSSLSPEQERRLEQALRGVVDSAGPQATAA
jgi:uncharacterized membrane protein